ncbi:MAG: creatininase family protein [Aestuariivirga sp.]|uniref:creatininase family protein n=1 Tax=Aestuariivirga sp. TaxID=2650926 RepID=UPI0038D10A5C
MLAVTTGWDHMGEPDGVLAPGGRACGIHAGGEETSVMLALHPELVRMEQARDFISAQQASERDFPRLRGHGPVQFGWKMADLNGDGAAGNAAAGNAEKGHAIIDHQALGFIDVPRDVHASDLKRLRNT